MWNNLVFWRISALATAALLLAMAILYYQKVKKIQKDYDDSFDKARHEIDQMQEKSERFSGKLQEDISTLIDLLLILNDWAKSKDPSRKLEFQVTLKKLPGEIRKLVKIGF